MTVPTRLDWLISEWVAADQIEKDAADKKSELFALIATEMGPGESRAGVKMYPGQKRFDPTLAIRAMIDAPKQLEIVSRMVPQGDLAKKYLDAELLAQCMKTTRPYLRVVRDAGG